MECRVGYPPTDHNVVLLTGKPLAKVRIRVETGRTRIRPSWKFLILIRQKNRILLYKTTALIFSYLIFFWCKKHLGHYSDRMYFELYPKIKFSYQIFGNFYLNMYYTLILDIQADIKYLCNDCIHIYVYIHFLLPWSDS